MRTLRNATEAAHGQDPAPHPSAPASVLTGQDRAGATFFCCAGCGSTAEFLVREQRYGWLVRAFLSRHERCGSAVQIAAARHPAAGLGVLSTRHGSEPPGR